MKTIVAFCSSWIPKISFLLTLTILWAGCGGKPPQKPVISPEGEVSVEAGKTLIVKANSQDAVEYKWTLTGEGSIPPSVTAGTILYTAPTQGDTQAILTVIASNKDGNSPDESLVIKVLPLPTPTPQSPTGNVVILPLNEISLGSENATCSSLSGSETGKIDQQGNMTLAGLEAGKQYILTLNGKPSTPFNLMLCENAQCYGNEGYWDFLTVTADTNGKINQPLVVSLPPKMSVTVADTFDVKFFVKDKAANYCVVLGVDSLVFGIGNAP